MTTNHETMDKTEFISQENHTEVENSNAEDVGNFISAARSGHTEKTKSLLRKGVKIDAIGNDDDTALMVASQEGHTETVLFLLAHGATVDIQNTEGLTALHLACLNGHTDIVRHLLEYGGYVDIQSHSGFTPLLLACQDGHVDTVNLLLSKNAQTNTQDANGRFPLLIAIIKGQIKILESLLRGGANVNMQNEQGYTALMGACLKGKEEMVKVLLRHGADISIRERKGDTALDIARKEKHFNIEHILVDSQATKQSSRHTSMQALYGKSRSLSESRPRISSTSRTLSCDYPTTSKSSTPGATAESKISPFLAKCDTTGKLLNIGVSHLIVPINFTSQIGNQLHLLSHPNLETFSHTTNDEKSPPSLDDGTLHISQFSVIQSILWEVRPKWYNLAIQLQLDLATINVIRQQNPLQIDDCFTDMLIRWLNHEGNSPPTLESLIEALCSPPVDHPHLVEKLRQRFPTM